MKGRARRYPPMTRDEFLQWVGSQLAIVQAGPDAELLPCRCGDINCRGWRFVRRSA